MSSSLPASDGDCYEEDVWNQVSHARILVSDAQAGRVIGRAGTVVDQIKRTSGAFVKLSHHRQLLPGTDCRVLLVSGLLRQVMGAIEPIVEKVIYQTQGDPVMGTRAAVVLVVPEKCCGALIGKKGKIIKSISEASNAGIAISHYSKFYGLNDRLVTITGPLDNQLNAIFLILSELLNDELYSRSSAGPVCIGYDQAYVTDKNVRRYHSKGFDFLHGKPNRLNNIDDEQEVLTIAIADKHIGAVIGRAGRNLRDIKQATGASIRISAKDELVDATTDREAVISGTRDAIDAALVIIMRVVSAVRSGGGVKPPLKPDDMH